MHGGICGCTVDCVRDSDMQKCEDLCSCQNVLLNVVFSVDIFVWTCGMYVDRGYRV